jgi:hypothetical protein
MMSTPSRGLGIPLFLPMKSDYRIIDVKLSRALYLHQQHSTQEA